METHFTALLQVARTLDDLGVPYVVVGSVASSLVGLSRATADADIVADLRPEHVTLFFTALKDSFYVDDQMIRHAVQRRRSFNVIHSDSFFKVDIYIPADEFSLHQLTRGRAEELLPDSGQAIRLASPEDIILSKLRWYRRGGEASERQLSDVAGVVKVQGARLDLDYLREWAQRLNVRDLLEQVLGEATDI
jgi:predicted nucleotidyltransferase